MSIKKKRTVKRKVWSVFDQYRCRLGSAVTQDKSLISSRSGLVVDQVSSDQFFDQL